MHWVPASSTAVELLLLRAVGPRLLRAAARRAAPSSTVLAAFPHAASCWRRPGPALAPARPCCMPVLAVAPWHQLHTAPLLLLPKGSSGGGKGGKGGDGGGAASAASGSLAARDQDSNDAANNNNNKNNNNNNNKESGGDGSGNGEAEGDSEKDEKEPEKKPGAGISWTRRREFGKSSLRDRFWQGLETTGRVVQLTRNRAFRTRDMVILCATVGTVYGLGLLEGCLLLQHPLDNLSVLATFALYNITSAMVWSTTSMELVVRSADLDPAAVLYQFGTSAADAKTLMHISTINALRSVIAGLMAFAQIYRVARISVESTDIYSQNILLGKEPFLRCGAEERIIRLCGSVSHVTQLSMRRYGSRLCPVYEDPDKVADLVRKHWDDGHRPVYWRVRPDGYGQFQSWQRLLRPEYGEWTIRSNSGERILYIEADGTNISQVLALGKESEDLRVTEASAAYNTIEMVARLQNVPFTRVMRVFLADSLQEVEASAGNTVYTLRDQVRERKHADVVVDAAAPVLQAILDWCAKVTAPNSKDWVAPEQALAPPPGARHNKRKASHAEEEAPPPETPAKAIIFDTPSAFYFGAVKTVLEAAGYEVLDHRSSAQVDAYNTPRLIYDLNTLHNVISRQLVHPGLCCFLTDSRSEVRADLEYLSNSLHLGSPVRPSLRQHAGKSFDVICTAEIHDDLLRQVRVWTRLGFNKKDIQAYLDRRIAPVLKMVEKAAADLAKMREAEESKKSAAAAAAAAEETSEGQGDKGSEAGGTATGSSSSSDKH